MKQITFLISLFFIVNITAAQTKSYKRGVAYGYHSAKDMEKASQNISWWYNWAAQPELAIEALIQNTTSILRPWPGTAPGSAEWAVGPTKIR